MDKKIIFVPKLFNRKIKNMRTTTFIFSLNRVPFKPGKGFSHTCLIVLFIFTSSFFIPCTAQVGINPIGTAPSINAILDLNTGTNNNLGLIVPNVSLSALSTFNPPILNAPTAGDVGMMVYNANASIGSGIGYYYWNGSIWTAVGSGSLTGSGIAAYVAVWTPSGTILGTGLIQDNGTAVGINNAPVSGTMLNVNSTSGTAIYSNSSNAAGDSATGLTYGGYFTASNGMGVYANGTIDGVLANGDTAIVAYGNYNGINIYAPGNIGVYSNAGIGGVYGLGAEYGIYGLGGIYGGEFVDQNLDYTYLGDAGNGYGVNAFGTDDGGYFSDPSGDYTYLADKANGYGFAANGTIIGGYCADGSGDTAYIADGITTAGGYFKDAGGDYTYIATAGSALTSNVPKSTEIKDENGKERMLYCNESPEILFEDYGEGQLVNGKVHINLDPLLARNVTINEKHPLRVFIQLYDDENCKGVIVKNRSASGFDVVELNHGTSNTAFGWHIICNRANEAGANHNFADKRFPIGPGPMPKPVQAKSAKLNKPVIPASFKRTVNGTPTNTAPAPDQQQNKN
jgi:hypothetical protein